MTDEKDRFGDTMRLVERAREDIYFWMEHGELEGVIREISRGPLGVWIDKFTNRQFQT
ncbi:MAG TPA: hypothetical protein VGW77_13605 [Candidatus Binatia bacterium]|jgi:hypothetical protein|nr:hypothetical protein [Candidatus Binatia bacterium]